MEIKKICVLGSGAMGHGIAQTCAQGGFQFILEDIKEEFVQAGLAKIRAFLKGSVERQKMTQADADSIIAKITTTTSLSEAAREADMVIEAIVEDMKIKKETFKELDQVSPPHTIFATNTSYQSVTEMAAVTRRPDKFVGMHWFNPPQIMRGIEIIKTEKTSQETIDIVVSLCRKLGKESAVCVDSPGFIANRLVQVWRNQSFTIYDEGIASFRDIDIALKTAFDFRMGPFELGIFY